MLHYGEKGDTEAAMACAFVADAVADLAAKLFGREADWGVEPAALDEARAFVATYRDPAFLAELAFTEGPRHLDDDFELVQDTFRRFAEDKIRPAAEHIHRFNDDIPEEIISGPGRDGRLRPVDPRGVRRLQRGRRERVHRHGRGHRGAVAGLARRGRLAHHPARDPDPGPPGRRHRGAEAVVAPPPGHRRGDGRRRRHRARLRLRRGRHQGHGRRRPTAAGSSTASRPGARSAPGPTC